MSPKAFQNSYGNFGHLCSCGRTKFTSHRYQFLFLSKVTPIKLTLSVLIVHCPLLFEIGVSVKFKDSAVVECASALIRLSNRNLR